MEESAIYLGVDVGTQGVRGIVYGRNQVMARAHHPLHTHTPQSGWAVQSLDEIWNAFATVVRKLAAWSSQNGYAVRAIGLDATSSIVIVDDMGLPKTDVLLWMDIRASAEARTLSSLTGREESPELPWAKALWLEGHYPDLFSKGHRLVEIADWVTWRLTGEWSRTESSAILKWHGKPPTFLPNWARRFDRIIDALPARVVGVGKAAGIVRAAMCGELGLPSGYEIDVAASMIDAYAGAIGADAVYEGDMALILGSSSCQLFHGSGFVPTAGLWGPFRDLYHNGIDVLEAGQPSTGSVVRWVENLANGTPLETLESGARAIDPGSDGVKVHPAFQGIRSPWPNGEVRGSISGLSLHHNIVHVLRAVYEGTAVDIRRVISEVHSVEVKRIIALGGGTHSQLWLQIIADVCAMALEVADADAVTRGAAMLAERAVGVRDNVDGFIAWPSINPSDNVHAYSRIYEQYLEEFPTYRPN